MSVRFAQIRPGVCALALPWILAGQVVSPVFLIQQPTLFPPAISASGTSVAFGSAIAPDGSVGPTVNVYVAAADGTNARRLSQPPRGASSVTLSADGTRVAYVAQSPAGSATPGEELHIVDVAAAMDRVAYLYTAGCIQPLCVGCASSCVHEPHFTADAGKLLFAVSGNPPFFVVNADGSAPTRLPVYTGNLADAPARVISRGGIVVFTSAAPNGPTFAAAPTEVYTMNLDGTNIHRVVPFGTDPTIYARNAVISADGTTVAFESNFAGLGNPPAKTDQVWVSRVDGTGLRQLTTGSSPASNPTLSADGSLVAFVQNGQALLARSDGTSQKKLTSFVQSVVQDPVLNDNGTIVVFTLAPLSGQRGSIYAISIDGANLHAVYAPPVLTTSGITGASAGSLVSIYGANFRPDSLVTAAGFPLPQSLGGVSLLVNGNPVPLLAVSAWQINAQLPPDLPAGNASFQVMPAGSTAPPAVTAQVQAFAPSIFTYPNPASGTQGGFLQAAVFHAGTAVPCDDANPAAAGETVEIYGTGLGSTNPVVPAGMAAPASPPATTVTQPQVLIGQTSATVVFAGLTPGLAGVYQVNAVIPAGLRADRYPVNWKIGSVQGSAAGLITLR